MKLARFKVTKDGLFPKGIIRGTRPRKRTVINDPCVYCVVYRKDRPRRGVTREHIVPRSKGGGNGFPNVVGACQKCNRQKGSMNLLVYLLLRHKGVQMNSKDKKKDLPDWRHIFRGGGCQ